MKNFKLPLYHALYKLVKYLYDIVHNMPREFKYAIGQDIINIAWQCLDKALKCSYAAGTEKAENIKDLSLLFDCLKFRLRMASEIGAFSEGSFAHLQENYLNEIGKMLGGWLKWANTDAIKNKLFI